MTTATTAGLAAVDRWTDARLATHVRRTLHDDTAWAWGGYTHPGQVRRLRAALCALNGQMLGEAIEARHRMAPGEYDSWVFNNRRDRAAVDDRLAQVAALPKVKPAVDVEALLQPPPGEVFNFAATVARMAKAGMTDGEIGKVFSVSRTHIHNTRKVTSTPPGRDTRRPKLESATDPKRGLPYGAFGGYDAVHTLARKTVGATCRKCGTTPPVIQAALRPDTPRERLYADPRTGLAYSRDPADYFGLCYPCHRKLDRVECWTALPEAQHTARRRAAEAWGIADDAPAD